METELFFKIKNILIEMQHNDFNITDIQMYVDLEANWVVSYKYGGRKFVITNDAVGEEE